MTDTSIVQSTGTTGEAAAKDQVQLDHTHKNIEFGNSYRLELDKTMMLFAVGLFAFTISFPPHLTAINGILWMQIGWIGLGASVLGGFTEYYGWEKFYLTYRDYDHKQQVRGAGDPARKIITRWRRAGRLLQFVGFVGGVGGVGMFALINVSNIKLAL
jgi:hypothetical protein